MLVLGDQVVGKSLMRAFDRVSVLLLRSPCMCHRNGRSSWIELRIRVGPLDALLLPQVLHLI